MLSMRDELGVRVGYSDHTMGTAIAVAAAALGAEVIEKHFTLDRGLPGPDQSASLEPVELERLVRAIRDVESALGEGRKRPSAVEVENAKVARKSLVAARDIVAGEEFTPENVTAKRPGTGMSPLRWDGVIGTLASRAYSRDELLEEG
jgi:N,N'-diacetyllegionaminate synthase